MIQLLNNQAFPSAKLAHVDDLVVYAMFATKARPESYRAIKPDTISGVTMTVWISGDPVHFSNFRVSGDFRRMKEASSTIVPEMSHATTPLSRRVKRQRK